MAALTPRAALCAAQTVDYGMEMGERVSPIKYIKWSARRDGLTVHSSGGGVRAVYSGGDGCDAQGSRYQGQCSGAPPAGTALRTGDTLTWAAGSDDQTASDAQHATDYGLHARTSKMAGWELCFAR